MQNLFKLIKQPYLLLMKREMVLSISILFFFSICGCASTWNKQRKEVKTSYKRGEIDDEAYYLKMRKIDQNEQNYQQEAKENKILRQQAEERKREGYYIPPLQTPTAGKHKNCSAKCDYYGNCETVCE